VADAADVLERRQRWPQLALVDRGGRGLSSVDAAVGEGLGVGHDRGAPVSFSSMIGIVTSASVPSLTRGRSLAMREAENTTSADGASPLKHHVAVGVR